MLGFPKLSECCDKCTTNVLQICDVTKLKGFGEKEFFNFGKWCLENIMLKTKEHYRHSVL